MMARFITQKMKWHNVLFAAMHSGYEFAAIMDVTRAFAFKFGENMLFPVTLWLPEKQSRCFDITRTPKLIRSVYTDIQKDFGMSRRTLGWVMYGDEANIRCVLFVCPPLYVRRDAKMIVYNLEKQGKQNYMSQVSSK